MGCFPVDEIGMYLEQADEALNSIVAIDSFSEIFEAGDPAVKTQIENNEEAKEKSQGFLAKAAQALLNLFRRIKESVEDFFIKRKLDKEQREAYDAFVAACKQDPSLKNKKITVKDYRKICEEHDAILKEVEEADKQLAAGKNVDIEHLQKRIMDLGKGVGGAAATTMAVESVLNVCSTNQAWAKQGYYMLKSNDKLYETLVKQIGEKGAKRTEKDLKALSKRISLRRIWLHKTGRTYNDVYQAINGALNSVKVVAQDGLSLAQDIKGPRTIADKSTEGIARHYVLEPVKKAGRAVSSTVGGRDNLGRSLRLLKNKRVLDNFTGGEYVKGGINQILSTKKDLEKAARQHARGKIWDMRLQQWVTAPIDKVCGQVNAVVDSLSPAEADAYMALIPAKYQGEYKRKTKEGRKILKTGNDFINTISGR